MNCLECRRDMYRGGKTDAELAACIAHMAGCQTCADAIVARVAGLAAKGQIGREDFARTADARPPTRRTATMAGIYLRSSYATHRRVARVLFFTPRLMTATVEWDGGRVDTVIDDELEAVDGAENVFPDLAAALRQLAEEVLDAPPVRLSVDECDRVAAAEFRRLADDDVLDAIVRGVDLRPTLPPATLPFARLRLVHAGVLPATPPGASARTEAIDAAQVAEALHRR